MLVMVVFFIAFRWIHLSTPLIRLFLLVLIFLFFQAEDGIRDLTVTGVQTCALPIFALLADSQFRSLTGPARLGSTQFVQQARDLITLSANLTDTQKMIAEYWGLGPNTNQPPGQWDVFAQFVSRRDHHTVDQDAKMFFAMTNAIMDAGIAAWDDKRTFDSVRPITAIRWLFQGQQIQSWGGPGRGTVTMDGGQLLPDQKAPFPTPPFAQYAFGHS